LANAQSKTAKEETTNEKRKPARMFVHPSGRLAKTSNANFMKPFLLFALCTVVLANSCKQKPTEPILTVADTTSHNFTWHLQTLGDFGSSSTIFDVAIINDSLAYAVGEIYLQDSTGIINPTFYNLAKWDGHIWQLSRVYYTFNGQQGVAKFTAIYAFGENDIWAGGTVPHHWDGNQWTEDDGVVGRFSSLINRFWGTSDSNLYIVGSYGNIAHYDGVSWNKIPSGTSLDIQDIFGATDSKTGQTQILAVASNPFENLDRKILSLSPTLATSVSDANISWSLSSIWFVPNSHYFVAGSGIYEKSSLSEPIWKNGRTQISSYYISSMRGNAANDVVGVGGVGEVIHYNGSSWQSYYSTTGFDGNYYSVAIKGNLVIAVGSGTFTDFDARGAIAIGKRTK
jgi:hypothetical protein